MLNMERAITGVRNLSVGKVLVQEVVVKLIQLGTNALLIQKEQCRY